MMTGEGSIREMFSCCRGENGHGHGHLVIAVEYFAVGILQRDFQGFGKGCINNPLSYLRPYTGKFVHVVNIKTVEKIINLVLQAVFGQKLTVGVRSGGKTTGNRYTCIGEITDHFTERGIFAAYPVNIGHSQMIKPDYVIFQSVSPLNL